MRERHRATFRYRRGMLVTWAASPGVWRVRQQQITYREVLAPVVRYLLEPAEGVPVGAYWAYEADLDAHQPDHTGP